MNQQDGWGLYVRVKRDIFWFLVWWLIAVFLISFVVKQFHIGFDDTDGDEPSGMEPSTDAKTGCQYLQTSDGGITPRMNADGSHMCQKVSL